MCSLAAAALSPPRALWVPFMLGRPFGAPGDPAEPFTIDADDDGRRGSGEGEGGEPLLAVGLLATAAHAGFAGNSQTYTDSQNDLFDNGLGNLDIASVTLADDGVNLTISVTTRDFQSWTKYMMYFDTASGGTNSNGWSRYSPG